MDHLRTDFKCSFSQCPYGSQGRKSFKKEIYLQQHLKNVHEEKAFECTACHKRFAFEWQLKYHCKYCGAELKCTTCAKVYANPMSLVMHCKRTMHPLPKDHRFKLRNFNCPSKTCPTYIFVPIFIEKNLWKNKFILPKDSCEQSGKHSNLNEILPIKVNKKNVGEESIPDNKRSTDCQTVRKRNRASHKHSELKSIQTQTLHSSFEATKDKPSPSSFKTANTKCSSFTQTLLDHMEQNEYIVKDAFLSNEMTQLEQSVQTEFVPFENCNTIETQTNTTLTDFNSDDLPISVSNGDESQFEFSDLEFIDIETQTIWNNDRTTQTENDGTFDNWIINDDY